MLHPVATTGARRIFAMRPLMNEDEQGAPHSIGELSRLTGVNIETIRYYEQVKILPAPPRTEGGRRVYRQSHRGTLGFIRRARDLGFSLDEIRALLDLDGSRLRACTLSRSAPSLPTSRG